MLLGCSFASFCTQDWIIYLHNLFMRTVELVRSKLKIKLPSAPHTKLVHSMDCANGIVSRFFIVRVSKTTTNIRDKQHQNDCRLSTWEGRRVRWRGKIFFTWAERQQPANKVKQRKKKNSKPHTDTLHVACCCCPSIDPRLAVLSGERMEKKRESVRGIFNLLIHS